MSKWK